LHHRPLQRRIDFSAAVAAPVDVAAAPDRRNNAMSFSPASRPTQQICGTPGRKSWTSRASR